MNRFFLVRQNFATEPLTFIIDGKKTNTLKVSINPEFKYLTNLFDMFTAFELEDYNKMSTSYGQELYRLIKQFRTTGFYRVKIEDLRHMLSVPKNYTNAKMDQVVFSKTTVIDLTNAFSNFKIKQSTFNLDYLKNNTIS